MSEDERRRARRAKRILHLDLVVTWVGSKIFQGICGIRLLWNFSNKPIVPSGLYLNYTVFFALNKWILMDTLVRFIYDNIVVNLMVTYNNV